MYTVRGSVSAGTLSYDYDSGQAILLKGNQAYYYDLPSGKLSLVQAGANTLIFTYNGPYGLLSSVSNLVGQSIQFNWSNGYMTSIVDSGGNTWTYGYSGSGMLSSVVAPGASADTRSYLYENADATLLTGISINGSRYSTYSYDGAKRVAQVVHTGGEVSETFAYGVNQTTVTDARGQSTTYSFTPVNGALQISGVSRAGTSTCPATASSTAYDANGWVDYTYDWNGTKTDYTYDASGRMLQVTEGAGTAATLTTVHQ